MFLQRYEVQNSKLSTRDSYLQDAPGFVHAVGHQEAKPGNLLRQKSTYIDHTSSFPRRNSSLDKYDDPSYNSNRSHKRSSKHRVEGMSSDSFLNQHSRYGGKIASKQALSHAHEDDDVSPEIEQRSEYLKFKPSISTQNYCEEPDMEERGISTMTAQVFISLYFSVFYVSMKGLLY